MNTTLKITNIGKYRGEHKFEFENGIVTKIQGENALGKTLLIKSIAAAISLPIKSELIKEEAIKFGILGPLVNDQSEIGEIELFDEKNQFKVILSNDGAAEVHSKTKGNEKFLYAGTSMKNSRMRESISKGQSDFKWIIDEMSLANAYSQYLAIIESTRESIDIKIIEIQNSEADLQKTEGKIAELESKLPPLTKELNSIETKIIATQTDEKDQKNKEDYNNKLIRIKGELKKIQKGIDDSKKELNTKKGEIKSLQKIIAKSESELLESMKAIDEYKTINEKQIKEEIDKIQQNLVPLREKKGLILGQKELYELAKDKAIKSKTEEVACPLCHDGKVILKNIENELNTFYNELTEINSQMDVQIVKINTLQAKVNEKNEKLPPLLKDLKDKKAQFNESKPKLTNIEREIKGLDISIKNDEESILPIQSQVKEYEVKIAEIEERFKNTTKEGKKLIASRDRIRDSITKIETQIDALNEELRNKGRILFYDIEFEIPTLRKLLPELNREILNVRTKLLEKINHQRRDAAENFNLTIEKVLKNLQFTELKSVRINLDNFNLEVFSKNNSRRNLSTLSGAEQGVIAALLQLSCKEAYVPEIPFFIADDSFLDLDPNKTKKLRKYLQDVAVEQKLYIIIVELTDDKEVKITPMLEN